MRILDIPTVLASADPTGIGIVSAVAVTTYLRRWLRRIGRVVIVAGLTALVLLLFATNHDSSSNPPPPLGGADSASMAKSRAAI